jgi:predicted lipoprotein with Yx(FWY)xxD motif
MLMTAAPRSGTTGRPARRERRRPGWVTLPLALGAVALTAACGPSYGGASAAASSGSMPATAGTGAVVATAATGLGTIVVDGRGRTVYEFANDTGSRSTCDGECASDWPPVPAPATLPANLPGVSGRLGSTMRADGGRQLTVAGHPVYTFSGDSASGQTHGNGITLNGGRWTAVTPAGSPVGTGSSSASTGY